MPKNSPNNPSRHKANFEPCTITPGDAHLVYLEMKRPTIRQLAKILKERGERVSEGTIAKWSRRYRWSEANAITSRRRESEIIDVLEVMGAEGLSLKPEIVAGVQARLMVHLGQALGKVECKTPADVVLLLEACEKLRALSHTVRGDAFSEVRKTGEAVSNGPNVTLGSFKPKLAANNGAAKPNGNGEDHG